MDITTLRIVATVVSLATFVGIWIWAWRRANVARFDAAAQLPFQNDD